MGNGFGLALVRQGSRGQGPRTADFTLWTRCKSTSNRLQGEGGGHTFLARLSGKALERFPAGAGRALWVRSFPQARRWISIAVLNRRIDMAMGGPFSPGGEAGMNNLACKCVPRLDGLLPAADLERLFPEPSNSAPLLSLLQESGMGRL